MVSVALNGICLLFRAKHNVSKEKKSLSAPLRQFAQKKSVSVMRGKEKGEASFVSLASSLPLPGFSSADGTVRSALWLLTVLCAPKEKGPCAEPCCYRRFLQIVPICNTTMKDIKRQVISWPFLLSSFSLVFAHKHTSLTFTFLLPTSISHFPIFISTHTHTHNNESNKTRW